MHLGKLESLLAAAEISTAIAEQQNSLFSTKQFG